MYPGTSRSSLSNPKTQSYGIIGKSVEESLSTVGRAAEETLISEEMRIQEKSASEAQAVHTRSLFLAQFSVLVKCPFEISKSNDEPWPAV
jgi:hypothetical protein